MQGEFRGDFTRDTFDPRQQFLRVLMQQGRVQLDADWNEQVSILLHYLQALATDLIGPYGGPADRLGFEIIPDRDSSGQIIDLKIGAGRYYVDGILCENADDKLTFYHQIDYPLNLKDESDRLPTQLPFIVYLDVWEQHITSGINEVALGDVDTATRSQVIWQVKAARVDSTIDIYGHNFCDTFIKKLQSQNRGLLRAKAWQEQNQTEPCIIKPDAQYRGMENQLYRVEIHNGGSKEQATFKYSRENSSVFFPIDELSVSGDGSTSTATVKLKHLGRDSRFSLTEGDWVEIVDDNYSLRQKAQPLWQVDKIDSLDLQVILKSQGKHSESLTGNVLRRWDQKARNDLPLQEDGTIKITEASITEASKSFDPWIALEKGVQIQWLPPQNGLSDTYYQTGTYWLIPARTAVKDVLWPQLNGEPTALPPHGIDRHYAPLAIVVNEYNNIRVLDCRRKFYPLANSYLYGGESWRGIGHRLL